MQDVAAAVRQGVREGQEAVVGRVIDVKGFSTLPGDVLVAMDSAGDSARGDAGSARRRAAAESGGGHAGDWCRRPGDRDHQHPRQGGRRGRSRLRRSGRAAPPAGFAPSRRCCGSCWRPGPRPPCSPASRAPAPARPPRSSTGTVRAGARWAAAKPTPGWSQKRWRRWRRVDRRRGASRTGRVWCSWRPGCPPLGWWSWASGDMVAAIRRPGRPAGLGLPGDRGPRRARRPVRWAGATAALIVLSHDPHVDTPALAAGLARRCAVRGRHGLACHPVPPHRASDRRGSRPGRT